MNDAVASFELSTFEAYELWAELYPPFAHNPLMRAEQHAMLELLPQVTGQRVLDLACGSGRYAKLLAERGAAEVIAADFSPAMLRQVAGACRVRANIAALPFANGVFDAVVSGLALGHADNLIACMQESARVLKAGGLLLYSDFHPEATRAGLKRGFKDSRERSRVVPTQNHDVAAHRMATAAAGFELEVWRELRAGIEVREEFTGSESFYRQWRGLPLVLVVRARKVA